VVRGGLGLVGLGRGDEAGLRLGLCLAVAFLPAAVIGLLLDDLIEDVLFGVWPIVASWFVGGVVILLVAHRQRRRMKATTASTDASDGGARAGLSVDSLSFRLALLIGLAQCVAMWPGTSRSLMTIVAGLLAGLSMAAALEFSFLLGVVTLLAATIYKALLSKMNLTLDGEEPRRLVTVLAMAHLYGWGPMLVGLAAAAGSAWLAVKGMVAYLSRHGLELFGWYRIAAAAVTAGMVLSGYLSATHAWD
jgi:undecaprenyl-diphosphatase